MGPSQRPCDTRKGSGLDNGHFKERPGEPDLLYIDQYPTGDATCSRYDDTRMFHRRSSYLSDGSHSLYPFALSSSPGKDLYPELGVADFTFEALPAPLSVSTASLTSSVGSGLSPLQSEFSSQPDMQTTYTGRSRGPSPLRHSSLPGAEGEDGEYLCLASGCEAKFRKEANLESHVKETHSHICLWGNNGPCDSGGFATRDDLNWHVKVAHLLICPVPGCVVPGDDTNPTNPKEVLDCHIRWAHKGIDSTSAACRSSNLLTETQPRMGSDFTDPESVAFVEKAGAAPPATDEKLKMEMSIGISKKRCREQLKNVVAKKLKRFHVSTPRSAESPGFASSQSSVSVDSASFPVVWEHGILPFLAEFIPKWCGLGHSISVTRGRKPDSRRVCFMTKSEVSMARKIMIAGHVRDLLPERYRNSVSFIYSVGQVDKLVWARGLGKDMPDEICAPRNPFFFVNQCMGDSIGTVLDNGDDVSATLGPAVSVGGGNYWLASFHPFIEGHQSGRQVKIEHPSLADRERCTSERHDVLNSQGIDFNLGILAATSGHDLKTTRVSHEPYWEDCDKEGPLIVTDWTLISSRTKQANLLRRFPSGPNARREVTITKVGCVTPGAEVCSTGRTSGHQRGMVCEIPAYIDGKVNGTGKATREWFIEEPYPFDNENEWIRGGIGVQGDSGAAIVDCDTNALVGQLWGRNKYYGSGPRFTYFTPMSDIFDDIQEKCGEQTRPQLPQYRDEAYRLPEYPVCRPCFDLREYMDSRRSSRHSLVSMIAGGEPGNDRDHDLTSVSELATPKTGVGEQPGWIRHAGTEEVGSSFRSLDHILSPSAGSASLYAQQAPSPGFVEVRSPYALMLNEEDLYDTTYQGRKEVSLGKRPEPSVSVARAGLGKRQRLS